MAQGNGSRRSNEADRYERAADGDDLGEATYAMMIKSGKEIHGNGRQRLRVVAVVPFEEKDKSPYVGLLQVEAA
jgi:hypothetical protein